MKFIGITKTDPTTLADNVGTVEIGDGNYQPKLNDMVVYGTKEYIWRQGQVPDPEDSTKTINLQQLVAGFIEGAKGEPIVPIETIRTELNKRVDAYKDQYLSKTFGDNKKKSEDFIAKKAKEEGIQKLPGGTLYKVLSEGNGPKPAADAKVQVIYEGKTIDGNVFDSSEKNNGGKPTEIMLNQVIPAWQQALTLMPEGSEWELYVPYNQAYGNRDMGQIKPYSALIFKIKLVKAASEITLQGRK